MVRFLWVAVLGSLAAGSIALPSRQPADPQETPRVQDEEKMVIPPQDPADVIARRDFMRTKLMFTNNLFKGLTLGDIEAIEEAVSEIEMITEGSEWVAIDNDQYRKLTDDFKTATARLKVAVKTKNLDAIALRYYNLSTSCLDCHKHIREASYSF